MYGCDRKNHEHDLVRLAMMTYRYYWSMILFLSACHIAGDDFSETVDGRWRADADSATPDSRAANEDFYSTVTLDRLTDFQSRAVCEQEWNRTDICLKLAQQEITGDACEAVKQSCQKTR